MEDLILLFLNFSLLSYSFITASDIGYPITESKIEVIDNLDYYHKYLTYLNDYIFWNRNSLFITKHFIAGRMLA